jgi:lipopolysaccharide biosynthesis regulator YciM
MDDINKNISELDVVKRVNEKTQIQPLTYLILKLVENQENNSNAAGFIDASGKCIKLTKKQIREGFKPAAGTECDTESKGDAATVKALEEYLEQHPEYAQTNEKLKKEVNKAGGWEKFMNNFNTWAKTEQGTDILNTVGGLFAGLMGKQTTPDIEVKQGIYGNGNGDSKGLSPVWWVVIGVGGLALLGGIAFAIIKFGVKKQ